MVIFCEINLLKRDNLFISLNAVSIDHASEKINKLVHAGKLPSYDDMKSITYNSVISNTWPDKSVSDFPLYKVR